MAKKMYQASILDDLIEDIGWEHEIPYRDFTRVNAKKTTSRTIYVEEGRDEKPISYRAVNLLTFFIERPQSAKRVFRHHFPDLYDKYVDCPQGRNLMTSQRARGPEGNRMNVLDRKAPIPIAQIINRVEGRDLMDDPDNIRRHYVELYRMLVQHNPRKFSVNYVEGDFGSLVEQDEMTKVVYSELETNSATDF